MAPTKNEETQSSRVAEHSGNPKTAQDENLGEYRVFLVKKGLAEAAGRHGQHQDNKDKSYRKKFFRIV